MNKTEDTLDELIRILYKKEILEPMDYRKLMQTLYDSSITNIPVGVKYD